MVMGSVLLLVIFLAAWQWAPGLLGIPAFIVPPPAWCGTSF
jgi:NitT/TauT family transport system permease protein